MIKMFEKGRIFICPDFDIHKILNSFPEHEIDKAFEQIILTNKDFQVIVHYHIQPPFTKKCYHENGLSAIRAQ